MRVPASPRPGDALLRRFVAQRTIEQSLEERDQAGGPNEIQVMIVLVQWHKTIAIGHLAVLKKESVRADPDHPGDRRQFVEQLQDRFLSGEEISGIPS